MIRMLDSQVKFARRLAAETGLNTKVIQAWMLAEMGGATSGPAKSRDRDGNYNWLNIAYFDTGPGGITKDKVWRTPESAARATAQFLRGDKFGASSGIRKILNTAGKDPQAQMSAIANSGWASSGYRGGSDLRKLFSQVSGMKGIEQAKGTGGRRTAATSATSSGSSPLNQVLAGFQQATKQPTESEENPFGDPAAKIQSMTQQLLAMKSPQSSLTPTASSPSPLASSAGGTIEGAPGGHVKPSSPESAALLQAIARRAEKMGLHVGEFGDAAPGVHTDTSYHYRKVPGTNTGRGMDVSGDADKMRNFSVLLEKLYGGSLSELFYNGPGGKNRKNGKRVPIGFVPKHTDHVHVAV